MGYGKCHILLYASSHWRTFIFPNPFSRVCQRPKAPAAPAPKPAAKKAAWACWFGSKLCQSWRYSPRLVYLWICLFSENYEGHLQPMHIVIVAQRFLVAAAAAAAAAAAKQESQGSELRHYCNIHHGSDGYPTFDRYPFITQVSWLNPIC